MGLLEPKELAIIELIGLDDSPIHSFTEEPRHMELVLDKLTLIKFTGRIDRIN
jgi:hypothetical protein